VCDSFDFFLLETAYFKEFGGFADKTERRPCGRRCMKRIDRGV